MRIHHGFCSNHHANPLLLDRSDRGGVGLFSALALGALDRLHLIHRPPQNGCGVSCDRSTRRANHGPLRIEGSEPRRGTTCAPEKRTPALVSLSEAETSTASSAPTSSPEDRPSRSVRSSLICGNSAQVVKPGRQVFQRPRRRPAIVGTCFSSLLSFMAVEECYCPPGRAEIHPFFNGHGNAQNALLLPPMHGRNVLGICKWALVNHLRAGKGARGASI